MAKQRPGYSALAYICAAMPINRNALVRYKVLDSCFSNRGRQYTIDDLVEVCNEKLRYIDPDTGGIRRRQVQADIQFMESDEGWNIELERIRVGKKMYLRYADRNFSIQQLPVNPQEIAYLRDAFSILTCFQGMPQFEWAAEALPRLSQYLQIDEPMARPIMSFDHNPFLTGVNYIGQFYQAIYNRQVLRIQYKPFEVEEPLELLFHPYYLKQYNNRWFVLGLNAENGRPDWNLALDRVQTLEVTAEPYQPAEDMDWDDYFHDIIGVTKPDDREPERIVLVFEGITSHYIASKPLHGSQKTRLLRKDVLEVVLRVIPNYELEWLLMSYADSVTVQEPAHLKDKLRARLEAALNKAP